MTPTGQSFLLFQLQQIDSAGDERLQRLQQIEAELADRSAEAAAAAAAQAQREELARRQVELRDLELALGTLQSKLRGEEHRLYEGRGSPRELAALQHEVESLRNQVTRDEDAVLAAMEGVEEAEEAARVATETADAAKAEGERTREQLQAERDALRAHLERLQEQRSAIVGQLPASILTLYDHLRRQRGGRAVVEVVQGRCRGCRLTLPALDIQKARRGAPPHQCPTCQRILYVAV